MFIEIYVIIEIKIKILKLICYFHKFNNYRECFDFATARAVSNLRDLSEYCLPFVKKGGTFISMKSAKAEEEIAEGRNAIKILGGNIKEKKTFEIDEAGERTIILIEKISTTPAK